jgi:signal transduction histidine kinase
MFLVVTGLVIAITLLNLYLIFGVTKWSEDFIFTSLVEREFQRIQSDPTVINTVTYPFELYRSIDSLPQAHQNWLFELGPGIHELEKPRSLIAKVGEPQADGSQNVVIVDTSELEYIEQNGIKVLNFSGMVLLVAIIAAFGISFYLIRRIVAPLRSFTAKVGAYEPGKEAVDFSEFEQNDEIGLLASAFDSMQQRISKFIAREKRFTADVSHELRTPLTVISHSLELLQTTTEISPMQTPFLDRIDRGLLRMKTLVETFLAIGRKPKEEDQREECSLESLITEAIHQHELEFPQNPVCIEEKYPSTLVLMGERTLLSILIRNLINDAALHAPGSLLTIRFSNSQLIFENPPFEDPSFKCKQSTGLGLSIVERVVNHLGYEIHRKRDSGLFKVVILLSPSNYTVPVIEDVENETAHPI